MDRTLASPMTLDGEHQVAPARAPGVGEHSRAILAEYGFGAEEIDALCAANVVIDGTRIEAERT
jgi:formyl-CoA transferase